MSSKALRATLVSALAIVLLLGAFSGGVLVGWAVPLRSGSQVSFKLPWLTSATPQPGETPAPVDKDTLFKPFWQAWDIVHQQYVDQPVNDEKMMQGAISGMMESLGDKHTSYMNPDEYRQQTTSLQGDYEGIGAWVDTTADYVTIINPMPGSPAEKAGLKTGDKIIAVDKEDVTGIDGNLVLRRVLGPAGTSVTLTIQREGETKPMVVTIVRAKIVVPSVETKMLDGNIAYLHLVTYGDKSSDEVRKALKDLLAKNPKGLVFDLRNNGGGYLETAIQIVSEFIDKGTVMYEQYGDGTRRTFTALSGGVATKIPLVVLVNEGTASASEITAGAIQDYGRGKLVGAKTYGKGSVQNWIELNNQEGAVRVTIARWLTPKERQINEVGLQPDVEVKITEEDVKAGKDPQLDKAVELLK